MKLEESFLVILKQLGDQFIMNKKYNIDYYIQFLKNENGNDINPKLLFNNPMQSPLINDVAAFGNKCLRSYEQLEKYEITTSCDGTVTLALYSSEGFLMSVSLSWSELFSGDLSVSITKLNTDLCLDEYIARMVLQIMCNESTGMSRGYCILLLYYIITTTVSTVGYALANVALILQNKLPDVGMTVEDFWRQYPLEDSDLYDYIKSLQETFDIAGIDSNPGGVLDVVLSEIITELARSNNILTTKFYTEGKLATKNGTVPSLLSFSHDYVACNTFALWLAGLCGKVGHRIELMTSYKELNGITIWPVTYWYCESYNNYSDTTPMQQNRMIQCVTGLRALRDALIINAPHSDTNIKVSLQEFKYYDKLRESLNGYPDAIKRLENYLK